MEQAHVEQALQEQLAALVDSAVERVLHSIPGDGLLELQLARQENADLRAALREVQAVDDAEIKRLWGYIVQLEAKCTEFQRLGAGQPHVEASLRLEAAPQAAEVGPAAAAADGDVTAAQPSPSQQLQWRAARLRQQLDAKSAELAAIQEQLREQSAAARAAEEQVQAVQARAAAADQRAAEAEAKWQAGDAGRRQLQQQLKHQAAPRRDAAELPGSQPAVPCPATAASQPAAAAVPALAGTADAAAAASLPQLLQDFKQQIEASLRQELQQRLLPQLRHEISAAVQLHSQQQAVPQPRSMSPSVAHQPAPPPPLESPQGASGPGRPPPPPPQQQQQQAVPAAAANVAGATSRARSPSTSSVMDISEEDEAPPPPPPANPRQPASRQAADDRRVPPGFSLRAQQQAPKPDQQPADQLQPVRAQPQAVQAAAVPSPASVAPPRPLPSPQQAAAGQVLLPPPPQLHLPAQPASWQQPSLQQAAVPGGARGVQGEAQQAQPPLAGSAGAQVAAAVAAARALSAGLTSAAAPAGAQPKAGRAITTAPASQEKQQQQQKPQQQQEKPQQKQPPQQQREQQRAAAAVAEASDQPAAAPRAPAVPAGAPPQQRSQEQHDAAQAEAAAEELPPWLAVAASIRAQQRQAASPGEAGRRKLHQWQQLATAHADTAPGRPPKTLPFAVAEGADPVDIVAQAAAGQLPYCCPPCRAVFPSQEAYLEHQSQQQHADTCRSVYSAYTGNVIARNREAQISRVAGGSPKVKLTPEQRSQQFCCLACSRVFILEQFIHHLVCANHLQKCQVQLSAFGNAAKRQKV